MQMNEFEKMARRRRKQSRCDQFITVLVALAITLVVGTIIAVIVWTHVETKQQVLSKITGKDVSWREAYWLN